MLWIKNPARLKSEVAGLEALRDREGWLLSISPYMLKNLNLAVEFVIDVNSDSLKFTLEYPAFYPDTPPKVMPRGDRRLSSHQYGPGGELCLEYRPDNWDPAITGAMMVESTYRLLAGEQPAAGERAVMPSAHHSTLGQRLRGTFGRFFLTSGLQCYAAALNPGTLRACRVADIIGPTRGWTAHVLSAGPAENPEWHEDTIPVCPVANGVALLVRVESVQALKMDTQDTLDALLEKVPDKRDLIDYSGATCRFTILADHQSASLYCSLIKDAGWILLPYLTVDLTSETSGRVPEQYATLRGKKVGIVGCGSLGSKIATSLARSGVGSFVLVDDDIVKPGNLVRNDLDVAGLGSHKVDALEARLMAVSPYVRVSARRVILGGQESAGTTESVLDELGRCDLLVDATADPQAFNFVAAVSRSALLPMIWAEVYAGGIGGFVARLRPDIEPPPNLARQQYLAWCESQGVTWRGEDHGYENRGADAPIVADDADVAMIAAHAARMATDHLVRPEASFFPHPAYFIGLSKAWLFAEPLDIRPLDFVAEGQWRPGVDQAAVAEALDYIVGLFKQTKNEDRTGT